MMARKLNAIRQLSLQCETPPPSTNGSRRASLKKQQSEECNVEDGMRISVSAKGLRKPVKIAWDEGDSNQINDSILYSRQDLAQKLRIAWHEKEKSNKLNIFLAHNMSNQIEHQNSKEEEFADSEYIEKPKILQPLHPEVQEKNTNLKLIFQKHLRKASQIESPGRANDSQGGSTTGSQNPVVVVPIIEKPSHDVCNSVNRPRPSTGAAQKRAMFQKRTNSAFQTPTCQAITTPTSNSNRPFRPPMIRASSLPNSNSIKTESKCKFPRKKIKSGSKRCKSAKEQDADDAKKNNNDVVTMVSLVSPSESETEESEASKDEKEVPIKQPPVMISSNGWKKDDPKNFTLRKTIKQVSFQQSSIHAVRSFSASFPARRASVVSSGSVLDNKKLPKTLEKRSQIADEQIDAKRRLLRQGATVTSDGKSNSHSPSPEREKHDSEARSLPSPTPPPQTTVSRSNSPPTDEKMNEEGHVEPAKERKCWETYCRMTKSGLNVSFDTILRGMLTPTEYRIRRQHTLDQEALALQEQKDISENETNTASVKLQP